MDSEFAMDEVRCNGEETTIQECDYTPNDDCSGGEGAGVICQSEYRFTKSYLHQYSSFV